MTTREFNIAIHGEDDGSFWGEVVELPGCFVSAHSLDELRKVIEEAIPMYLSGDQDKKGSLSRPGSASAAIDSIKVAVPISA